MLNGGYAAWQKAEYPVSDGAEFANPVKFRAVADSDLVVTTDELLKLIIADDAPLP